MPGDAVYGFAVVYSCNTKQIMAPPNKKLLTSNN